MRALLRPALFAARRRVLPSPHVVAPPGPFRLNGGGALRTSVIHAPGPPDPSKPAYEVIAPGPGPGPGPDSGSAGAASSSAGIGNVGSSKSQHPFAEIEPDGEIDAGSEVPLGLSGSGSGSGSGSSNTDFILSPSSSGSGSSSNLPSPPTGPLTTSPHFTPPPGPPHPFDTHAFVAYLESHSLPLETSRTLMEGTRSMIVSRSARARARMLGKEEMENAAYLFRAALGELRTELNVRARSDGLALRGEAAGIRREVEGLEVKMKEDVQTLRHEQPLTRSTEIETNNRKEETRTEMKGFEIQIEEINNKFTISLGDLRTEIESAKWDATRRAISIIVLIVVSAVAVSLFTSEAPKPASASAPAATPAGSGTQMRDAGVGSDTVSGGAYVVGDDELLEDGQVGEGISDERLEKLLREKGVGEIAIARDRDRDQQQQREQQLASKGRSKRRASRSGEGEIFVDRI